MDHLIETHHLEAQVIASIRDRCPQQAIPALLQAAFAELFEHLGRHGVHPIGPPFVIYHEFGVGVVDAEVSVPIGEPCEAGGRVASRVVPAMTVARILHVGPYERLGAAYASLFGWIGSHGYRAAGPIQERYLNGPGDGVASSAYRTEVELPVMRLAVAAPV